MFGDSKLDAPVWATDTRSRHAATMSDKGIQFVRVRNPTVKSPGLYLRH